MAGNGTVLHRVTGFYCGFCVGILFGKHQAIPLNFYAFGKDGHNPQ